MYLSIPYKIMYLINLKRSKNFLREERSASIVNIYWYLYMQLCEINKGSNQNLPIKLQFCS